MAVQPTRKAAVEHSAASGNGALERKEATTSLADVVDTVLDKGMDVEVLARATLGGVELARIDARVIIASIDSYLRLADAASLHDLENRKPRAALPPGRRGREALSQRSRISRRTTRGRLDRRRRSPAIN